MKLLIKIFSQTTCIILLVSSGIFLYTTYCWKNQSIQNINSYESSIFRTNILQFENKTSLSDNQKQNADNEMRPQIVTYAFRQVFHDSAVLYLDGKMIYNGTVYEFDVKKLRELCESKANMVDHGSNSDGHGPMISQINGRTLLLFYYGNVNMGYQIITYKDITDVIEKSHLLFFQTGGFTLSLIVVMGIILYLSLRKITAPLTSLREATLLVSEGIYDFKVPSEGNTELAQVGATFNFMTGKIKEQIESLSNINRTQKQLIGSLAHELKTPMNIAEFIQRRHHAGGRQGHTTLGKAKAEIVEHDFHRRNDVVEVQQRLAHAHHYYVGNGTHAGGLHRADDLRRAPDLADNFGYPQVAVKALLGGGAEFALQRAAYLGGDAQGGAVFFRDIDGLDALIANGNRPFDGPVG